LVAAAIEAALAAGRAILPHFTAGQAQVADRKGDGSPVTVADRAGEAAIVAILAAADPATPIIAEEAAAAGTAPAACARFWCVDPLDGTRQFIAGMPDFAVCIGLIENGYPIFGVLHRPVVGDLVIGGGGVVEQRHPQRLALRVRAVPAAPVAVASRSAQPGSRTSAWLAARGVDEIHTMGSAWKFAEIASGRADIYYRPGETSEWDTAAGQAILEAAGGWVTDLDGVRLGYGKPNHRNTGFVAGTGDLSRWI
jgi:3'(2'),5'-bisphosphate nucleotidase